MREPVGRFRSARLFVVLALVALVALVAPVRSVAAESDEPATLPPPPAARGAPIVRSDAAWRWQLVTVPRISRQLGALAVSGVEVAAGRSSAPVAVLGDPVPGPPTWPYAVTGERRSIGPAPDDQRIAAAFGVTTFQLRATDQGLEMLELRLLYQDGVAVWLNGIEIVRQALPRRGSTALSPRPHGPEWETFYIPVAPGLLRLGANTLAIEVHPSARRTAPTVAVDLIARRDRGILRGPVLVEADQTTATIAVDTDHDVEAVLEWGVGDSTDQRQASTAGRRHRFKLTGLPPNVRVGYRVLAGATRSPRYTFHTMPAPGGVVRIGVYGDVRGGHEIHRRLVHRLIGEGLDAVCVTGDMVLHGADEGDWQRFFAIASELLAQVPYWPAVGNHDLGWDGAGKPGQASRPSFALPDGPPGRPLDAYWYSRDLADVHLVFLDSNAYERPEQETWLEADLAAARTRGARAILVFTHDGPYARGTHGGSAIARDRYVPILLRHQVDLVFSGHDHIYQRGAIEGLRYVVTGGGGASLYGIRCGIPGRPRCRIADGMQTVAREHHYVVLTIGRDIELCTRRPDGTLLEKCVRYTLRG